MIFEMVRLSIIPSTPPISPIKPDSIRNISLILSMSQPRTFMTPISLVLSYIDIIMVLAMPMAATKRDTAPMPPSTACCMRMLSWDCSSHSILEEA